MFLVSHYVSFVICILGGGRGSGSGGRGALVATTIGFLLLNELLNQRWVSYRKDLLRSVFGQNYVITLYYIEHLLPLTFIFIFDITGSSDKVS